MKQHTDFNDLAQRSELGQEAVKRQVNAAVGRVLGEVDQQDKVQRLSQEHKRVQVQAQQPRRAVRIG